MKIGDVNANFPFSNFKLQNGKNTGERRNGKREGPLDS